MYGQSYSCTMDLPYVQDFNNAFSYQTPYAGSAVDMTLLTEDNCWTQYIYRSVYTVCSMISPNHMGPGNHALWMFAGHPMAGQHDRVEYTYTVSPPFRDVPSVISFDVQYIWYDSVGYFGIPDGLPWHAGILQMGYITNESEPESSYFPIDNIVIDTAAWFSGNTANTDHWQHYRLDLRTRYSTLPSIRCLAFKPVCNMDSIGWVQIFVDNLRVADEMDTVDYRDTICPGMSYTGYGFMVDSTETLEPGVHTFQREVMESNGMVCYRLLLTVYEPTIVYLDTVIDYGDTIQFLDSLITGIGDNVFYLTTSLGCDSTVVLNVDGRDVLLGASPQRVCPGEEVILTVSGAHVFRWHSIPADPMLEAQQGHDTVTVYPREKTVYQVLDADGNVLAAAGVEMESCESLWIPNTFTPDEASNNLFAFQTTLPVVAFEMTIYTRTGHLVWHCESIDQPWDGTRNGIPMPQGTYVYFYRMRTATNGHVRTGKGTVTLLR